MNSRSLLSALVVATVCLAASIAEAQPVGTFRWQLQPYCNVVTVAITQNGAGSTVSKAPTINAAAAPTRPR